MAFRLNHIGLVFPKISGIGEIFRALGLGEMEHPEPGPIQKASERFVALGDGQDVYIELLEPIDDCSPVFISPAF